MYRRLIILSLIIIAALCGLSWLGYRAISMWAQGIEGTRISEFVDVAEQIRFDVNETLTAFKEQEKNRPYTDYQYYSISEDLYVPEEESQVRDRGFSRNSNNIISNGEMRQQIAGEQLAWRRSPLADKIDHGLAYFNFQYDNKSNILTSPNGYIDQQEAQELYVSDNEGLNKLLEDNFKNVGKNLLPVLEKFESNDIAVVSVKDKDVEVASDLKFGNRSELENKVLDEVQNKLESGKKVSTNSKSSNKSISNSRTGSYDIQGLQSTNDEPLVQKQYREFVTSNTAQNGWNNVILQEDTDTSVPQDALTNQSTSVQNESGLQQSVTHNSAIDGMQQELQTPQPPSTQMPQMTNQDPYEHNVQDLQQPVAQSTPVNGMPQELQKPQEPSQQRQQPQMPPQMAGGRGSMAGGFGGRAGGRAVSGTRTTSDQLKREEVVTDMTTSGQISETISPIDISDTNDIVEVIIEPFNTIVIPEEDNKDLIFGGQVFMVRRVKIEGKELFQGFQLNEKKLLESVEESTKRFVREGMSYDLGRKQNGNSAYTAILDFGFGHLFLNLFEDDPGRFIMQINHLRKLYFGIIAIVFLAVTMAVTSLWLNARAQLKLAQKKDDFVSAVSHELRTPLTSIRMHAEMLEKNWIKSPGKLGEYYRSMRTESERLSRLIENVLDFSRIQKGRKRFQFKLGDINKCVADVVEMMRAYAAQRGFQIQMEPGECDVITFDSDAVTQIVVNLIDNAVKYSTNSEDKTITVRTKGDGDYVLIEVEDHGPGIPHRQKNKIFQEFYRIGAESTRETTGSGLGLALVKKFAQAHNGFVEIINAKPSGAIFRVSLAAKL